MIVYVESNFVLEMALEQEQALAARSIVSLAEKGQIELAYPSFVLSEPFENISRARRERNDLQASMLKAFNYLKRSEPYKEIMLDSEPMVNVLKGAYDRQIDLLHVAFDQLISVGRCINIDIAIFREASACQRSLQLSPQDSIIYSAVISDLKEQAQNNETKCFLSRDRKAFGSDSDHEIKLELGKYNCRCIGHFTQGLDFIQSSLKIA